MGGELKKGEGKGLGLEKGSGGWVGKEEGKRVRIKKRE